MMKIFITLLVLLANVITASAQTYAVGTRNIVFTDPARSNRAISTDLYYPSAAAGANVPLVTGSTSFPVVVFGHGFLIGTNSYQWLADSLAKHGFIVALPATESGILPSHANFGNDLAFLCSRITSLNDSTSSFLYQRLIKKAAVGGHSMGGGSSFLAAAQSNASIAALFNFSAAETNPSATTAALSVTKPALIFSGSSDCIAAPSVQQAMYNNIPSCKFYINVTSALHCQFANNNGICVTGQVFTGCNSSSISTTTLFSKTMSLLLPFLDYQLKDICLRGNDFDNTYNTITGITKQRSCLPFPVCGVLPVTLVKFTASLVNGKTILGWNTASETSIDHYSIERSQDGITFVPLTQMPAKGSNGQGASYKASDELPYSGISFYRLNIVEINGSNKYSDVVKINNPSKIFTLTALYPNPVTDLLTLQMQSQTKQRIIFTVTDITGRKLFTQQEIVNAGTFTRTINCSKLSPGNYVIQYHSDDPAFPVASFKFVKE